MRHFSIIIPTLNEAGNILPILDRIERIAQSHELEPEILFVDDGSTDGTRERIQNYGGPLNVHLIKRDDARGLASAVVHGANAASHELVVVMDADLSHQPELIPSLIQPLTTCDKDMVIGSRYINGGETPEWPLHRKIGSKIATMPATLLTGVRDPLSGFFALRKDLLAAVAPDIAGFKIGFEILAQNPGLKVDEVPISFYDRSSGSSKMDYSVSYEYFCQLWRLFHDRIASGNIILLTCLALLTGLFDISLSSLLSNLDYTAGTAQAISLLLATNLGFLVTPLLNADKVNSLSINSFLRFNTIILFALFLRGGFFIPWMHSSTPTWNLLLLLGISTSIIFPTALHISRRALLKTGADGVNWKLFGTMLIAYTILLRLVYLGNIELIQEEAYYWNYSQHLAPGYLDHPPVVAILIHLGTLLFGHNELGVRFGSFICWFITALFVYKMTRRIFDKQTAFRSLILTAVLPIFFGTAFVITPDTPLIACWAGSLYFLHRALVDQHSGAWYPAGLWLGLGLASKYTIAFLGPAVLLFMVLDPSSRRWFIRPQPYLAALLAFVIFSPVIWWNYQHEWASFLFQSQGRLKAPSEFSTPELVASVLILLTPTGALAAVFELNRQLRRTGSPCRSSFVNRSDLFCLSMVLVPLGVFIIFSLTKEVKLNWTGPIWLSLLPFLANSMGNSVPRLRVMTTKLWPGTLAFLAMSYGAILYYSAIGLPGLNYTGNNFLFGWDDFARQVEATVLRANAQTDETPDETPLVVGMDKYRIASGLAFYRHKQQLPEAEGSDLEDTTGRQLFGYNALMYGYWLPPAKASNRDILAISENKKNLKLEMFHNRYRQISNIHEFVITKGGKIAGRYYYRLLTSYTPELENSDQATQPLALANNIEGATL